MAVDLGDGRAYIAAELQLYERGVALEVAGNIRVTGRTLRLEDMLITKAGCSTAEHALTNTFTRRALRDLSNEFGSTLLRSADDLDGFILPRDINRIAFSGVRDAAGSGRAGKLAGGGFKFSQ